MKNARRDFLKSIGLFSVGLGLSPFSGYATPTLARKELHSPLRTPVRIRGRVVAKGKGLPGVAVTDGLRVVTTSSGGAYELISDSTREYVYISLPSGYEIPTAPNGIANFYHRIRPSAKAEFSANFDLKPTALNDINHAFLVLADPQIQNRYEADQLLTVTAPDVKALVQSYQDKPVFGLGCGDLVFDEFPLFKDYQEAVSRMGIPFYQVLGNHDMDIDSRSDDLSTRTFASLFGPTYYSFNRGQVHYIVLDDVFSIGGKKYIGYLTEPQLKWLEQDLALVEKGSTVVVSLHIPAYTGASKRNKGSSELGGTVSNRPELYRLLEPFKAHIMSGHTHFNENVFEGSAYEHVHGTVCGAWWSGPICNDGTPNGYGVYEVNGSQLSWKYKSTGKPLTHQSRLYRPGTDPASPSDLIVNVWNHDPAWKVMWYQDGIRQGEMRQQQGLDPLSVELHTGPEKPQRRTWVEPGITDHLFRAQPAALAKQITVEITDRFGKVYTESVNLS
ncbi:calcineurin-like phosphoesterase family protein [soil metagenome]